MEIPNRTAVPMDYVERVYAGWLGKMIGVRHGSNIEAWTYDRILKTYGEIEYYPHHFKNFAADDDTNGPVFFIRALEDYGISKDITAEEMGRAWLNYASDGHGFFWWGGYGQSTEHTAYLNLKHGIPAPRSGSKIQNGSTVAEQIGGQIFIDVWGLVAPGQPELAALLAKKMASVSHDGEGVYGGMFLAACIATAFVESDIQKIIEAGLSVIPRDCEYVRMVNAVREYYSLHPELVQLKDGWREAFQYVKKNFGYDRYPGSCHIIPNAAVIVLSLLFGNGDFSRTINICNMCGWDTDCNVGNVGCIMGVRNGLTGIEPKWRRPINDFLCCSGVLGSENIIDVPWFAAYIARLGYTLADAKIPDAVQSIVSEVGPKFHFELPGSTHGMRTDSDAVWQLTPVLENVDDCAASGQRSLRILFDKVRPGYGYRVYHQTYYEPKDFHDNRYDPSFSPIIYPGQTVSVSVQPRAESAFNIKARIYVRDAHTEVRHYGEFLPLEAGAWTPILYQIPPMDGVCINQVGVEFVPTESSTMLNEASMIVYLDDMDFSGDPNYAVDFSKERHEAWTQIPLRIEITQFTYLRGIWRLEDGDLSGSGYGDSAECFTGDLGWDDYRFGAVVRPQTGSYHTIEFRVQGGLRCYAAGLGPDGKFCLWKKVERIEDATFDSLTGNNLVVRSNSTLGEIHYGVFVPLAHAEFNWRNGESYVIDVEATANHFTASVDGQKLIECTDDNSPYLNGQIGFGSWNASHTHYKKFEVRPVQI